MSTSPSRRDLFAELAALCLALFGVRRATAANAVTTPVITGGPAVPSSSWDSITVFDHAGRMVYERTSLTYRVISTPPPTHLPVGSPKTDHG
jgi:hypothetical protein